MSKFQSTISVVAALASIFGAGAAGWKLAQDNEAKPPEPTAQTSNYEQNINQLQQEIADLKQQTKEEVVPQENVQLPQQTNVKQVPQTTVVVPARQVPSAPVAPPPPVPPTPNVTP